MDAACTEKNFGLVPMTICFSSFFPFPWCLLSTLDFSN
jgi:hypothetical protein